ncbi:MAG: dihydropteroate synthase [Lachnospiraceae bacterium]
MKMANQQFEMEHHTYVMGILNMTPDSFSDGGKFNTPEKAEKQVQKMIAEGADIIDIGGESTRPGYDEVPISEEINRVVPMIRWIKENFAVPVSVDTYKYEVAKAALEAGADMLNDISCLKDPRLAALAAEYGCAYCLMHNRDRAVYTDFMEEVKADLSAGLKLLEEAGVAREQVVIDPGVGFAKSYEQNLQIIARLSDLKKMGYPILLGTSRKSVIGLTLNLPVEERLEGTLATTACAVETGCSFVRVHDVKENVRLIRMLETIRDSVTK